MSSRKGKGCDAEEEKKREREKESQDSKEEGAWEGERVDANRKRGCHEYDSSKSREWKRKRTRVIL